MTCVICNSLSVLVMTCALVNASDTWDLFVLLVKACDHCVTLCDLCYCNIWG